MNLLTKNNGTRGLLRARRPRAFLLILVLLVIAIASLASLNFARSMLISHETAKISNGRLQARLCAESGAQAVRLFLAYPRSTREEMGGTWSNNMFYARNVLPNINAAKRGNFTLVAPSLDESGNFSGIRFGLQNESAKLNLNTLLQLDQLASSGSLGGAATEGMSDLAGDAATEMASAATASASGDIAVQMLMGLPGMTEEIAAAILDFMDEDEDPRELGAEFADFYQQQQPPYKPANGPLNSVEQLLQVRGVTPALLFGYDENRNGLLDQAELTKMNSGVQPGAMPGQLQVANIMATPPPPLGWSQYLTLHSLEKNVAADGTPRVNINGSDLQALYDELTTALDNEAWASFIVAFRVSGASGSSTPPLVKLLSMATAESDPDGALGAQLESLESLNQAGQGGTNTANAQPWNPDLLSQFDLTQQGAVSFSQVLDLVDATVTIQQGDSSATYKSPISALPLDLTFSMPILMDKLTTVDADSVPGRINIMECPREILYGVPGLTDDVVDEILAARVDGSTSETRRFETWLATEGYITMDEMRALLPLLTCGGDVFKAQIVGYLEAESAFSRVEAIVSGAGEVPEILFFRRLDHLGRGFDVATLGQRLDAAIGPTMVQ